MFAEVAVHTPMARRMQTGDRSETSPNESDLIGGADAPVGATFHYTVPAELVGVLQPGHLVWAPFGREELHGIVLALVDEAPMGVRPRALLDLVTPAPVCTPAQLNLARWLSASYLSPVLDCLLLMLPPGLAQKAEPVLGLTAFARAMLRLQEEGKESESQTSQAGLTGLAGLDGSPRTHPPQQMSFETTEFAEALHNGPYFPQLPDLKPDQHALLAELLDHEAVPERVLARKEGDLSRRSVLDPLIQAGLVVRRRRIGDALIKPKTGKQVSLAANPETIDQILPTLGRQSKQADVLAWIAANGEPRPMLPAVCEAVSCTPAPVRSLAERGWLRVEPDKTLTLLLPGPEVPQRLIELRGGEKYRRVLDALAGEAGPVWVGWLYAEADTDLPTLRELAAAGLIHLNEAEVWRDPLAGKDFVADTPPALTEDQARVWLEVERGIRGGWRVEGTDHSKLSPPSTLHPPPSFLLHGVTGSGKTEIYLRAIEASVQAGRQAIALVPEIALTPQTIRRFAARFGERVTVYHSDLSPGERYDVWRRAQSGAVDVVVGTRSALFLPLPRLGLIVLDEEHDPSYKESQRSPRYHARDAALQLGRLTGAAVILGSATPSLEIYYTAQLGQIALLELPRRIMGHAKAIAEQQKQLHLRQTVFRPLDATHADARMAELPPVQVVDLRQELRAGNRSIFSRDLHQAIDRVLASKQQAILFLNRRGTATFVMCRDCGHVLTCEYCDVPLTYHEGGQRSEARDQSGLVICHHCGRRAVEPERCPECGSRRIRYLGTGTEKIAEQVSLLWPQARVVRWDRDVTTRKDSHDAILSQFASHEADIMVGTQMIAKGLDLPLVTLVGVISADVGLYLPDFRAAERSFQLLTQVAGRAGRSLLGGQVIVQSYRPEHYIIQAARRHDYHEFSRQELALRRQLGYPPFRRLARLVFEHKERERVKAESEALARGLRFIIAERNLQGVDLIGPAPCFFGKEQGKYRWQLVVRAIDPVAFLRLAPLPPGWRIDVDPVSLL